MKRQIRLWGSRTFMLVAVVFAAQHWGMPLYKQYLTPKKTEVFVPTTKVKAGKFVISFHEIGTLEAEKSVSIACEVNGKIAYIISDGAFVSPGEKLVSLDTSDIEREARNQKLGYQNSLADVKRAKSEMEILKKSNETEIAQQQADLDFNKTELERAEGQLTKKQRLAGEKLIPRDQVDQAEIEVRSKKLAVSKGEMALNLKNKEVENKETQKQAEVSNKEFSANMSKLNLDDTVGRIKKADIPAPTAGMVVIKTSWFGGGERRQFKVGDGVGMGQIICNLPDLSSMLVKVQVGESDAPKLRVSMPVKIRLDAVPGKIFHGTVKMISNLATETEVWQGGTPGKKNFDVTIAVKEADPKTIKPGMTSDNEFICEVIKKAVYVPIETVTEQRGKTYVFVKDGKKFKRVPVKTGKRNDNFICVTKGLTAGQVVALRDPTKPLDHQESGSSAQEGKGDKADKKPMPIPGAAKS